MASDEISGKCGRWPLMVSIGLFVVACAFPALVLHVRHALDLKRFDWGGYRTVRGVELLVYALLFGWIRLNFTGLANLALWISWRFSGEGDLRRRGLAL